MLVHLTHKNPTSITIILMLMGVQKLTYNKKKSRYWFRFMVCNATFNNISVLLVVETGENHWPVAIHWQTLSHNVVSNTPRHEQGSNLQLQALIAPVVVNPTTIQWSRPRQLHAQMSYNLVWMTRFKNNLHDLGFFPNEIKSVQTIFNHTIDFLNLYPFRLNIRWLFLFQINGVLLYRLEQFYYQYKLY